MKGRSPENTGRKTEERGMLEAGIRGRLEKTVTEEMTARAMGSGELEVLATPALIALVEETAWKSAAEYLEPGWGTVGTKIDIDHISATPVGMKIWCETEIVQVDRRRAVFHAAAYDERGKIGEGTHERFAVQNESFMSRAMAKLNRE